MTVNMKQMIAETLARLLEHKSVHKITVKELVDACGISRQAFYYHFQDIMEVIEWVTAQALDRTVEDSLPAPTPQEAIKSVILSIRENSVLIRHLMASQRRQEIERLLVQTSRLYLEKMFRTKAAGLTIKSSDLETAINFYSYGLVGVLLENLEARKEADTLANQFCGLLTGEIWNGAQIP